MPSIHCRTCGKMKGKGLVYCENCVFGDIPLMEYITKETVLKMLNKIENAVEDGEGYQFNEWVGYVKELPTEEVQPIVHSMWLKSGQSFINPNKFRNYFCPKCFYELDEHIRIEPKFCQNCGAKMDGKEVEE